MKIRNFVVCFALAIVTCLSLTGLASAHSAGGAAAANQSKQNTHMRPLINYVQCNDTHYLEITYQNGNVCFANDGYIGLGSAGGNLSNVRHLHSGNNNGWILYYDSHGIGSPSFRG